ncbi:hypothetical protein NMY22_g13386 [Coprinellus aureogranulatus]|nr:hypothetical protein NMY22_g13386 [Coprinellus aureogranulatus]
MKLIAAVLTSIVVSPMMANALWCNCVTNRGDPFNDYDQTYSVCRGMPNAVYAPGNWFRTAHCDVGSEQATFRNACTTTYAPSGSARCW